MLAARRAAALAGVWLCACAEPGVDWQGRSDPRLDAYQDAFLADAGSRFDGAATADEFVALARAGRVLWLGDHHRHGLLHRRQLALLDRLHRARVPMCLLLEALGTQDQATLDAFGQGRIGLDELAATVRARWPESWLDAADVDSDHYRALLAFAQQTRSPVLALEPTPRLPLAQRDAAIASAVRAAAARHADRLVVVVVGQAHLLGQGRLLQRTGLPGTAVGAQAPPQLRAQAPAARPQDGLLRSDAGLWFFADLLPAAARARR